MNIINLTTNPEYGPDVKSIMKLESALINYDIGTFEDRNIAKGLYWYYSKKKHSFMHLADYPIYQMIKEVPIFLVTQDMCGESMNIEFLGHTMNITVPKGSKQEQINLEGTADSILEDTKRYENPDNKESDKETHKTNLVFDPWGVYIRPTQGIHNLKDANPMVFLWVDEIFNQVNSLNANDYNLFLCQAILHEAAHVILDIYSFLFNDNVDRTHIPKWYSCLKEESLAEAMSLTMMLGRGPGRDIGYGLWNKFQVSRLRQYIKKNRPYQYRLGASLYFGRSDSILILCSAIIGWNHCNYSPKLAEDWLRCIKTKGRGNSDFDLWVRYEEGFLNPSDAYKYKSPLTEQGDYVLCSVRGLVRKVIRDYAEMQHSSKLELMAAFPEDLHSEDIFIDETKLSYSAEQSSNLYDINELMFCKDVICSDGVLKIRDVWFSDNIRPFVEHARKLGFEIIDFWNV